MIGLDTQPKVDVQQSEYQRLLGLPSDYELSGTMAELAQWARSWYAEHGRPWVYTRHASDLLTGDGALRVDGTELSSPELLERLKRAEAHSVVVTAVGAGPEAEAEAQRLWDEGRPDEYFFLTVYASAVVEHLTTMTGARLCAWADDGGMAVLPHYSPGYPGWDMSDQAPLWALIQKDAGHPLPVKLEVLSSGMLRPKKSQLSAFGLTRRTDLVKKLTELVPCESCSYLRCQYRRKPYQMPTAMAESTKVMHQAATFVEEMTSSTPLARDAEYAMNSKVLERWRQGRLKLEHADDGRVVARFHSEGSTCSNMGWPLAFDHTVTLSSRDEGYRIMATSCTPSHVHDGYKKMCTYMQKQERQLEIIDEEKPLLGQPLDRILDWTPAITPAGCYCSRAGRNHKWRNVLQTLHYALVQHEKGIATNPG